MQIAPGKETAIATLFQLLETTENELIRLIVAQNLLQIDNYHQNVIDTLCKVVQNLSQIPITSGFDKNIAWEAIQSLTRIDSSHQLALTTLI